MRARLRPRCARHYPALEVGRAYEVVGEEMPGRWLADAGGDPFVTGGRRFVTRDHLEMAQAGR